MFRLLMLLCIVALTPVYSGLTDRGAAPGRVAYKGASGYSLRNGEIVDNDWKPTMAVQDHYSHGVTAYEAKNWRESAKNFEIVVRNFPDSPFEHEARYLLGVSLYNLKEFEFADEAFTRYLLDQGDSPHFEEAARYKLAVAEAFRGGARKRLFGFSVMPRMFKSTATAVKIYDELITMMPGHEIAAQAMLAKGHLQLEDADYSGARDTYYLLTRRFPGNPLAAEAYICISQTFAKQVRSEANNPDLLPLATINLRRFEEHFPNHPGVADARAAISEIREELADAFYGTARFYERVGQPRAAAIYYLKAVQDFPDTAVAQQCRKRLENLQPQVAELAQPKKDTAA